MQPQQACGSEGTPPAGAAMPAKAGRAGGVAGAATVGTHAMAAETPAMREVVEEET